MKKEVESSSREASWKVDFPLPIERRDDDLHRFLSEEELEEGYEDTQDDGHRLSIC